MIGPALKSALAARRTEYNARFAAARRKQHTLDAAIFGVYLAEIVNPVAERMAAEAPDCVAGVVDALYDIGLALGAQGGLAVQPATSPLPPPMAFWRDYLLALGPRLGEAPARLAGSGWNALRQLAAQPGVQPERWLSALRLGTPHCSGVDALLDLGRVAAWHAGAAQHRAAALDAALRLPPAALAAALGLERPLPRDAWHQLAAQAAATPADWLAGTATALMPLGWIGGFVGFGGTFERNPRLGLAGGRIVVSAGEQRWALYADGYGSALLPAAADIEVAPAAAPGVRVAPGKVGAGGTALVDAELVDPLDSAVAGGVLAVSLAHSFRIGLYRLPVLHGESP